jgi:hypothetical protein
VSHNLRPEPADVQAESERHRKTGSKNRQTVEREKAKKIAAPRAEIWKNAPPIDFKAPLDSLEIMEGIMRHFHQRALIEQRMGPQADWSVVDALMLKTLAAAEKVARYRHAQLSAVRLAGDIGKMDDFSLDELLVTIKQEWAKLSPLIDLDAVEEPDREQVAATEGTLGANRARFRRCAVGRRAWASRQR